MEYKMTNHDVELIKSFVLPNRRSRFLSLLESQKGRAKFLMYLDHFDDFDPRYTVTIPSNQQTSNDIEEMLKKKGAPKLCHVTSSNIELDNKIMPLRDALIQVVGMNMGTFLSCIPGTLAYFESEDPKERFVLEK